MPALAPPNSYDLSQSLPTMPTAAPVAPAPLSARSLTLAQSNAAAPAHPFDWAGRTGKGGASPFVPPVHPVAPAAPVPLGGGAPPETGAARAPLGGGAPPETEMGPAALNVIPGGVPSAVPGLAHPTEHAQLYARELARQQDAAAFNGSNVNEITTLGPNSPRMEAPAHPAAVNVIRGGVSSESGGGGGGVSPVQLQAIAPFLEPRLRAQADPTMVSKNFVMDETQKEFELQRELQQAQAARDPTRIANAQKGLDWINSQAHQNLMYWHMINAGLVLPTMQAQALKPKG